jgi:malate synthase
LFSSTSSEAYHDRPHHVHGLQVATDLYRFIEDQVLPGTGVDAATFWKGFDAIVADLAPEHPPCWPSATACRPSWTPGTKPTRPDHRHGGLPRLPEIGYLVPQPPM